MKQTINRHADRLDYTENTESKSDHDQLINAELLKYCTPEELEPFKQYLEDEGWENYDGIDTWKKGFSVFSTRTVYKLFSNDTKITTIIL